MAGGPAHLFKQQITYAAVTTRDSHGRPTLGARSTALARVQPTRKVIKAAAGDEQPVSHVVYTMAPLTLLHRVWFPGEDTDDVNRARRPIAIDSSVDAAGVTRFYKVWF